MGTMTESARRGNHTAEGEALRPVLWRVPEAMSLLNVSRSVLYEQIRSGRLRTVKVGRTRLVPAGAIDDYVRLLERESG